MYNADRTRVRLTVNWAIGIFGTTELQRSCAIGNRRLDSRSRIRSEGLAAGIPLEVMEWLRGAPMVEVVEFPASIFGSQQQG
jgi:hypothetical protein